MRYQIILEQVTGGWVADVDQLVPKTEDDSIVIGQAIGKTRNSCLGNVEVLISVKESGDTKTKDPVKVADQNSAGGCPTSG